MPFKNFLFNLLMVLFLSLTALFAQDSTKNKVSDTQHGQHFIDKDGDGYNDNAPDHDNDGIPNGLDPDWQKDKGKAKGKRRWRYIDLDGDGINDNLMTDQKVETPESRNRNEQQEGSSIDGQEPRRDGRQKKKKGPNK
jgi:hypothetical protein